MDRRRLNSQVRDTRTRIVWRDGRFRVECSGLGEAMRVVVFDEQGQAVAEETVSSAEAAWVRGTTLCRQLEGLEDRGYRRDTA